LKNDCLICDIAGDENKFY